jgi:microcystin-dependent protein
LYNSAGLAVSDLNGVVAGADGLASQFDQVKVAMQDLQSFINEFKSNYYYAPVGLVAAFGGAYSSRPPAGWLFCDGGLYSSTEYAALAGVLNGAYGTSGSSFRVPDLRGRVPLGQSSDVSPNAASGYALSPRAHGIGYGSEVLPAHTHDLSSHSHNYDHAHDATLGGSMSGSMSGSTSVTGYIPRSNGTGGAWNGLSPGVGTAVSYPTSVSGGVSGSVTGTTGSVSAKYGSANTGAPSTNLSGSGSSGTGSGDASGTHGVVQPSLAMSFIIKF